MTCCAVVEEIKLNVYSRAVVIGTNRDILPIDDWKPEMK